MWGFFFLVTGFPRSEGRQPTDRVRESEQAIMAELRFNVACVLFFTCPEALRLQRMAQEHKQSRKSSEVEETEVDTTSAEEGVAERKEQLDEDIDAILGEIDDVLETNAEDFVKSFVQKGGQ